MKPRSATRPATTAGFVPAVLCAGLAACGGAEPGSITDPDPPSSGGSESICELRNEPLVPGGPGPDGIYALTLPDMVEATHPEAAYLRDDDRVLGVVVDSDARAYPHDILWWHEIVNDEFIDGTRVTVSFCPLTGSGLAWNSRVSGELLEFAVSGLLFANNLVMFDRQTGALFGPQMSVSGKCGDFIDDMPEMIPVREMSWGRWQELYPHTRVMSDETGFDLPYGVYPYGSYDELTNEGLLFPMDVDRSRPIKERVLGIRLGETSGIAYPFGTLEAQGSLSVINEVIPTLGSVAIFYERGDGEAAIAYRAEIDGAALTFDVRNGSIVDDQTGSTWELAGRGVDGPFEGRALDGVPEAYVSFWFAWQHFQPHSVVVDGPT